MLFTVPSVSNFKAENFNGNQRSPASFILYLIFYYITFPWLITFWLLSCWHNLISAIVSLLPRTPARHTLAVTGQQCPSAVSGSSSGSVLSLVELWYSLFCVTIEGHPRRFVLALRCLLLCCFVLFGLFLCASTFGSWSCPACLPAAFCADAWPRKQNCV